MLRRLTVAREQFAASGTTIVQWSTERGFNPNLVQSVLSGKRACVRGECHRIAVALGVKDDVPPPGPPARAGSGRDDRLDGVRK